jgi:hypothetical protein
MKVPLLCDSEESPTKCSVPALARIVPLFCRSIRILLDALPPAPTVFCPGADPCHRGALRRCRAAETRDRRNHYQSRCAREGAIPRVMHDFLPSSVPIWHFFPLSVHFLSDDRWPAHLKNGDRAHPQHGTGIATSSRAPRSQQPALLNAVEPCRKITEIPPARRTTPHFHILPQQSKKNLQNSMVANHAKLPVDWLWRQIVSPFGTGGFRRFVHLALTIKAITIEPHS